MDNQKVIEMWEKGVDTDAILETIRSAPAPHFSFSTNDYEAFSKAKLGPLVLKAMSERYQAITSGPAPKPTPNAATADVAATGRQPAATTGNAPALARQPAATAVSVAAPKQQPAATTGNVYAPSAQEPLTNDAIVKMVKGGLGEDLIVSLIQKQPGTYALTPDDIVSLKQMGGLTDKVIAAMIASGLPSASRAIEPIDGKLPFLVGHLHFPSVCNSCDFGPMFVTAKGIEFQGKDHSFKWSNDQIKEFKEAQRIRSRRHSEELVEALQIKLVGESQSFLFVECGANAECRDPRAHTTLYDIVLERLGKR